MRTYNISSSGSPVPHVNESAELTEAPCLWWIHSWIHLVIYLWKFCTSIQEFIEFGRGYVGRKCDDWARFWSCVLVPFYCHCCSASVLHICFEVADIRETGNVLSKKSLSGKRLWVLSLVGISLYRDVVIHGCACFIWGVGFHRLAPHRWDEDQQKFRMIPRLSRNCISSEMIRMWIVVDGGVVTNFHWPAGVDIRAQARIVLRAKNDEICGQKATHRNT